MFKMVVRKLLLISSSTVHGYEYLQYVANDIKAFLTRHNIKKVLFVPYALPPYEKYYQRVAPIFTSWGFEFDSIHKHLDMVEVAEGAEAFFVGGGNTFLLLRTLQLLKLDGIIKDKVLEQGVPYIGTSAGANIATISIHTSNDMPIAMPFTLDALGFVPFNINPHYLDADENSKHKGETREERILQFLMLQDRVVLGMREGVHLLVENGVAVLQGLNSTRLFMRKLEPRELEPGTDISFLMVEKTDMEL